jgi:RNA polymerase sigma-70 factor (ECF subfamily)
MEETTRERGALRFEELLIEARAGSKEALGKVLEAFRHCLLREADRHLRQSHLRRKADASDLVQETFLDAQRGFTNFQGRSRQQLLAWLHRILLHNAADFKRRYCEQEKRLLAREKSLGDLRAAEEAELVPLSHSPERDAVRQEEAESLQRALMGLPGPYRAIIRLRTREGRSFEEIGDALNCSPEAARKLWARAVKHLARLLTANGAGPPPGRGPSGDAPLP